VSVSKDVLGQCASIFVVGLCAGVRVKGLCASILVFRLCVWLCVRARMSVQSVLTLQRERATFGTADDDHERSRSPDDSADDN